MRENDDCCNVLQRVIISSSGRACTLCYYNNAFSIHIICIQYTYIYSATPVLQRMSPLSYLSSYKTKY